MDQPDKVNLPAGGQLVRESDFPPVLVNGPIRVVRICICVLRERGA